VSEDGHWESQETRVRRGWETLRGEGCFVSCFGDGSDQRRKRSFFPWGTGAREKFRGDQGSAW